MPDVMAAASSVSMYTRVIFFPNWSSRVVRVAILVAGPMIRKTRVAPGDKPDCRKTRANGTDAAEQI